VPRDYKPVLVPPDRAARLGAVVARISRPATSGLKFLAEASRGRNRRERFALVLCGVTNGMVADAATRLEKLFAVQAMPTGVER
jgi:hypothetical protein